VPIHRNGEVFAVLDIDSPVPARFTASDQAGLESLAASLEQILA